MHACMQHLQHSDSRTHDARTFGLSRPLSNAALVCLYMYAKATEKMLRKARQDQKQVSVSCDFVAKSLNNGCVRQL